MLKTKYTIKASEKELDALIEILNEFSAGLGSAEDDSSRIKWLKLVDGLLKKSGIARNCK